MPEDVTVGKTPASKTPKPFQKRKQLERDIANVTEEMLRRNRELAETNKTLSLLRTIDALALESHASLKLVCEHITQAITQSTNYPFVALFTRTSHASNDAMRLYGWSGKEYLGTETPLGAKNPLHMELAEEWVTGAETKHLLQFEEVNNAETANFMDVTSSQLEKLFENVHLKTLYGVKLMVRRRVVGVLIVGFREHASTVSDKDAELIDRLAESIAVSLDNKLLFEENQKVLRQLRESNAQLRALDEAKDDFVSMASHQLRTPLTSIKGYTSMVLDGDAGEITEAQRKLLAQSLSSAQRMVYLIADLLNVSRLKTGKFVLMPQPTNLAEVVAEEIVQLKEAAKTRNLELSYAQPKDFPELMLDETKIRQLIMNFADNAIYYTPAGGHIEVQVINNPATVELRIKDDGMGVPKREQPHLFTKFYRAGNARKARPDGTGLGLFMAKKVIIAQGGSLIFDSEEGKGSTFGFVLSKAKLAVKPEKTPSTKKKL